jgi:hypothetical protein
MNHPPAPREAHRAKRRPGKAVLILAILAGCAATLVALLALISTTESPVDGRARRCSLSPWSLRRSSSR